jgi:hypothetical protein
MGTARRRTGAEEAVGLGVVSHSAEHAIREWLRDFRATWHPAGTELSRMRAETVRLVKHRDMPDGELWFITCDADGGFRGTEHWSWTVEASPDNQGEWRAQGVSGGGGSGKPAHRDRPWANLGGNWGSDGFRAGGTVEDAGASITRVRMTDASGRTFEDAVANSVVLFTSDEAVHMPMRVELIDEAGLVVDTDEWGFVDE